MREVRRTKRAVPAFTAIAALLLALSLAACHDEIPIQEDNGAPASVSVTTPTPDKATTPAIRNRQQGEVFAYGTTEQTNAPKLTHVSLAIASRGAAWDGVELAVGCIDEEVRWISISNLPWEERNRGTLLMTVDDQPSVAEDVYLKRIDIHHLEGREKSASADLDDAVWYEQLRSAKSLTIELLDSEVEPVTFDLSRFFGTPLQEDIDNCLRANVSAKDG